MKTDKIVLVRAKIRDDGKVIKIDTTSHKTYAKAYDAMKNDMFVMLKQGDYIRIASPTYGDEGSIIKRNQHLITKHVWRVCSMSKHWGVIEVQSYDENINTFIQADTESEINECLNEELNRHSIINKVGDCYACNFYDEDMSFPDVYKIIKIE